MSVGNNIQAVSFEGIQLTLVLGNNLDLGGNGSRNGVGKTVIINALSYALYGVALTNIKKDNLINKSNGKGMIVSADFEIDGIEYRIERGRRPALLKFYVDGIDIGSQEQQGENRETQKEIDKVIGFPHTMFKHLIALNTYSEPFLSMSAAMNAKISAAKKELGQIVAGITRSAKSLDKLESDLADAAAGQCPACGQGTAHLDTHEAYTKEVKDKFSEESAYIDDLRTQRDRLEEKISSYEMGVLPNVFYGSIEDALEHKHNLDKICGQFEDKHTELNTYDDQIQVLRETGIQEIDFDLLNKLTDDRDHQDVLYKLLTDKGSFIRKRIIDQNISYLNHRLAYYLVKLGLPHEVKFSNELTVDITEHGRDLDFFNLSRGEMTRVILALSFSFRELYESLNRPMNLLCIDELLDGGLDAVGIESTLSILKSFARDHNKQVLLISHREELVGRVNNILTVTKTGGFTEYSTDVDYVG